MISVIVPIYYGEKYIQGIIEQIEAGKNMLKNIEDIELLFVNDSPDAPLALNWTSESLDIIIINSDHHAGIHGARVKGLLECHGEYVLFLDQDDKIAPEYFDSQLQAIGDADAVVCNGFNDGKKIYTDDTVFKNVGSKEFVLKRWNSILSPGQVLIRKHSIPDVWIENIMQKTGTDDWFLWICMLAGNCKFSINDNILYEHVVHNSNTSADIVRMTRSEYEIFEIVRKKRILTTDDEKLLWESFFKINLKRLKYFFYEKKKLGLFEKWVHLEEEGIHIADYFIQMGIHTLAIYGCSVVGEFVNYELKGDIDVKYFIDRNASNLQKKIPVYTLEDTLPEVDGIIITLVAQAAEVAEEIRGKVQVPVFILTDCLMDIEKNMYSV